MITEQKAFYESPTTLIVELRIKSSLLQTSDYTYGGLDEEAGSNIFGNGPELLL